MQDPFSWTGTLAGHKCKDAQEGCATACSVFNCTESVGDFLCREISEEAAAESVCYGICGL